MSNKSVKPVVAETVKSDEDKAVDRVMPEGVIGYTDDGHPIMADAPVVEPKVTSMSKGVVDIMVDATNNKKAPKAVYQIPGNVIRRDN